MLIDIDGRKYYTLRDFSRLVNRSIGSLRYLMFIGNRIRKLKYVEMPVGKYNIPVEEYTEFPFTSCGRFASDKVYHFDKEGKIVFYDEDELQLLYKENNVAEENRPKSKEPSFKGFNLEGVQ